MNNNPEIQNDDEISLIDLFAVLLRYRRMICTILLCAILVVIAGYFIYPSWQKSKLTDEKPIEKSYETRVSISLSPGAHYLLSGSSLSYPSFTSYFMYPQVIHDALKEMPGVSPQSNEVSEWIPIYIATSGDQRVYESANKKFLIRENTRSTILEIICKDDDPQSGTIFLQNIFLHGGMALENYIKPLSKAFIDTYETTLLPSADSDNYVIVKSLVDGKTSAVLQLFEPYVLEQEQKTEIKSGMKYSVLALVIFFAAFFFSVFLAFCLNALKNIKNDQETMRKLRAALGRDETDK